MHLTGGTNLDEFYPEFHDRLVCPLKFQPPEIFSEISKFQRLLCETLSTHVRTTHTHVQKEKRETEINYTQILHMYYTCVLLQHMLRLAISIKLDATR